MSGAMGAAECGRVAVWTAGLCAGGVGSVLLLMLPRDRSAAGVGLAAGIALGAFVTVAWCVTAMCGVG